MSARKPAQHTVKVFQIPSTGAWMWKRWSGNHAEVAWAHRTWAEHHHCVRAARAEARLTGARLVIDGQEVDV